MKRDENQQYPWTYRRGIIIVSLLLCGAGLAYLTLAGADTRLNETLALGYFAMATSVIGAYVFGAVWHDRGLMAYRRGRSPRLPVRGFEDEDGDNSDDGPSTDPRPRKEG